MLLLVYQFIMVVLPVGAIHHHQLIVVAFERDLKVHPQKRITTFLLLLLLSCPVLHFDRVALH